MGYRQRRSRNWGFIIGCLIAGPLVLGWTAISVIGGSLVCADPASHCDGIFWPLAEGTVIIVAGATILGCAINLAIHRVTGRR
jgi:hypothetical protein